MALTKPAAAAAMLLALVIAAAPACAVIPDGACIIEVPVKGSVGLLGTLNYGMTYQDQNGNDKKFNLKVPVKPSTTGDISGVIPLVLKAGTQCSFTNTATTKGDPGYAKLTAALAGATIGTAGTPQYKLVLKSLAGTVTMGNPNSDTAQGYINTDYEITDLAMDIDMPYTGGPIKIGASKTTKPTVGLTNGTLSINVDFSKFGQSDSASVDIGPKDLKITGVTGCKVTVKSGAVALACANPQIKFTYTAPDNQYGTLNAALALKGSSLTGTAPLASAKVFTSTPAP